MRSGVPLDLAFTIIGLHLPAIIVLTIPIGVLLGTLLVFNRLSGDSEIIALRTNGVSFYQIAEWHRFSSGLHQLRLLRLERTGGAARQPHL
ncbi:MAG: LptF/LptG family permease [Cyanobacteriota/Melainabacteria group bacterium]